MLKRLISSIAGIALIAAIFWINAYYSFVLNLVVAVVGVLAVTEFLTATGQKKHTGAWVLSMLYAAVIPLIGLIGDPVHEWESLNMTDLRWALYALATLVYVFALMTYMILRHKRVDYMALTSSVFFILIIVSSLTLLLSAFSLGGDYAQSLFYVVLLFAAAWTADIGAYLAGTLFGKHKLIPEISPKKTVEGLIGGIAFDILSLILLGFLYENTITGSAQVNYLPFILIGIAGSIFSVIGDLTFSFVKRRHGVKDYGKIMPGHGGILDRIDSLIFVAPVAYCILVIFPILVG